MYAVEIQTPAQLPNATPSGQYNVTVSASGGAGGYTFASGGLPNGLTISPSGTISGTVTSGPSSWSFSMTVTDAKGATYSKLMSIEVVAPAIDAEAATVIAAADLNGDSIPDLAVGDDSLGTVMRIGNGDGTFQPPAPVVSMPFFDFAIADFNHDGTLDLAGGVSTSEFAVLLNLSTPPPALSVVSAASFLVGPLAPNEIATGFGRDLAIDTLGATSEVTVTDSTGATRLGQLYYESPGQINFVVPPNSADGPAMVTVISGDGHKSSTQVLLNPLSPALSTVGTGGIAAAYAIRVNPDLSQTILPVFSAQGSSIVLTPIDVRQPGSVYLILFGTGFDGATAATTTVNVQGFVAPVQYAGPQGSFAGLDQIGVLLTPSLAGTGVATVQTVIGVVAANPVLVEIQ